MLRNFLLVSSVSIALLPAQAPQAQQAPDFKGVVRKNLVPVSNEVLRVRFPRPVESKLKNGMTLLILEDHRSPTFQVSIRMPASSYNVPAELDGIAAATSALLRSGTKTRTSVQIADTLQELGASLNAAVGESYASINFSALSENLDPLLDLVDDVIFNPSFPQDELDKWKNRQISQLQQSRAQPFFLGEERLYAVLYPHDVRSQIAPSPESIGRITRDLVIDYYNKNFRPAGGVVAVSGDVSPKEIATKLDKLLGEWKGSAPKPPALPLPGPIAEKKIFLIDRPNSVQTSLFIANLAFGRTNPDYIAAEVANQVLGSGPASRLFRNIREEKGYTYGISSFFSASHYENIFLLSTSVRTEVTGPALEEILRELATIRDHAVPADELEGAKRALVARFALSTENAATGLNNALSIREYGFPANYWDTYPEKISQITAEDVQRVAKKYIPADNAQIVAVGDSSKLRTVLAGFGAVEEYDADGHKK